MRLHLFTIASLLVAASAFAHPMGNYSINQYWMVDGRGESLGIYYLIDFAEIPALKELDRLDPDYDYEVPEADREAYLAERIPELLQDMAITANGSSIPLKVLSHRLHIVEGMGGMEVVNVVLQFDGSPIPWPPAEGEALLLDLVSNSYPTATGTRECKLVLDGVFGDLTETLGDELKYQTLTMWDDNLNPQYQDYDAQFLVKIGVTGEIVDIKVPTPLAFDWTTTVRTATSFGEEAIVASLSELITPATSVPAAASTETEAREPALAPEVVTPPREARLLDRVTDIVRTKELSWSLFLAGLLIAAAMGAGHAFSPGHGKTVMAAYLIGERGTYRHAVILGVIVTITHTWSVLAMGIIALYLQEYFSLETVQFYSGIASGGIIVVLGIMLFTRRYASLIVARQHAIDHMYGHTHDHGDGDTDHHHHGAFGHHHHGPGGHSHVIETEDGTPPSFWQVLWLGVSGGIVPCPAAFIVLMLAIKVGRLAYGLWLIVAFSIGLAAVLVGLGIIVVRTAGAVRQRTGEHGLILAALPVASSVLITLLGAWVILWTLIQFEVIVFMPAA